MGYRHNLLAAAFAAIVIAIACGCGSSPSAKTGESGGTGVAATVNGEPISMSDYNDYMGMKQTVQVVTPRGLDQMHVAGTFGVQTMQELVNQKILMAMAKEQGVTPTDKDVDDELAFQSRMRPDYVTVQEQAGATMDSIRRELMIGLAREHLIMKGVKVGDAEVDGYIKSHPKQFMEPATAIVSFIEVTSPAKQAAVDAALGKGEKFGAVAMKLSDDPHAKETQGLFGQTIVEMMPKEVQAVVNATPAGQTSGWQKFGKNSVKFFVSKKTVSEPKAPTADQREILRRQLAMKDGLLKNDFDNQFYKRLKQAKVEVSVPYLKDLWQRSWLQMVEPGSAQAPVQRPR